MDGVIVLGVVVTVLSALQCCCICRFHHDVSILYSKLHRIERSRCVYDVLYPNERIVTNPSQRNEPVGDPV
jgi:hypothetical protein